MLYLAVEATVHVVQAALLRARGVMCTVLYDTVIQALMTLIFADIVSESIHNHVAKYIEIRKASSLLPTKLFNQASSTTAVANFRHQKSIEKMVKYSVTSTLARTLNLQETDKEAERVLREVQAACTKQLPICFKPNDDWCPSEWLFRNDVTFIDGRPGNTHWSHQSPIIRVWRTLTRPQS